MILKILSSDSPILRKKSKPVSVIDKKTLKLISDMKETLLAQKDPEGVGLAAPQVGKNLKIFLTRHKGIIKVIINPRIIRTSKAKTDPKKTKVLEGCLSIPKYYGPVSRSKSITISFMDESGIKRTETFLNFPAQIIQHEIDHLNGTLFVDKLLQQSSPLFEFNGNSWQEVKLMP